MLAVLLMLMKQCKEPGKVVDMTFEVASACLWLELAVAAMSPLPLVAVEDGWSCWPCWEASELPQAAAVEGRHLEKLV